MMAMYPDIKDKTNEKVIYSPVATIGIDYMYWVKIGNIILAAFMMLWVGVVAIANWGSYMDLIKHPSVNSVLYFGFSTVLMLVAVLMVALSIVLAFFSGSAKSSADDLKAVLIGLAIVILMGSISILVWTFKTFSISVNLSIILTFFYPISTGAVT